jgi:hypothetical protein
MVVGITFSDLTMLLIFSNLLSGTFTIPRFGLIVQNGKFSAGIEDFVIALNRVDLPTLGKPKMPHLNPIFIMNEVSVERFEYHCYLIAQ